MRNRSRKDDQKVMEINNGTESAKKAPFLVDKAVDPTLALLFASSVRLGS